MARGLHAPPFTFIDIEYIYTCTCSLALVASGTNQVGSPLASLAPITKYVLLSQLHVINGTNKVTVCSSIWSTVFIWMMYMHQARGHGFDSLGGCPRFFSLPAGLLT